MRHDLRLRLLAATGPGDRLPAEAIRRLGLYSSLSYFDMVASPQASRALPPPRSSPPPSSSSHVPSSSSHLLLSPALASPQVGLPKLLTLLCCLMLASYVTAPLLFRVLGWSARLVTRLRRAGWNASLAWGLGLAVGALVSMATCLVVFGLGTVGSMLREPAGGGHVAVDDGLSAEQRIVAKQQLVLIVAMAGGLGLRN